MIIYKLRHAAWILLLGCQIVLANEGFHSFTELDPAEVTLQGQETRPAGLRPATGAPVPANCTCPLGSFVKISESDIVCPDGSKGKHRCFAKCTLSAPGACSPVRVPIVVLGMVIDTITNSGDQYSMGYCTEECNGKTKLVD